MRCFSYLGSAEALVDGLCGLDGGSVDAPVEEEHHKHGEEKGSQGGIDDVARVVGQLAGPMVAVGRLIDASAHLQANHFEKLSLLPGESFGKNDFVPCGRSSRPAAGSR